MTLWFASLFLLPQAVAQPAPATTGDTLTFSLDRTGPPLVRFQIQLDGATGRGSYLPEASTEGEQAGGAADNAAGKEIPILVGMPLLKQLFAAVPAVRGHRCESHSRNLAQTGKKVLKFSHGDAVAECTFNYSGDERVNEAVTLYEALAQTMEAGGRLATKLRFDRLGLDSEMEDLTEAVKDGRAVELGNIAPVLQAIESDDRVMERVRRRAASLLETAGVLAAQPSGGAPSSER